MQHVLTAPLGKSLKPTKIMKANMSFGTPKVTMNLQHLKSRFNLIQSDSIQIQSRYLNSISNPASICSIRTHRYHKVKFQQNGHLKVQDLRKLHLAVELVPRLDKLMSDPRNQVLGASRCISLRNQAYNAFKH